MRFSRMWDIAGCRCILRNNSDVYKLRKFIEDENKLQIIKEYNYIESPQSDGYKSLHLFVKHGCSDTIVEVQLRCLIDHNWATLVEITDLLFDSKLKEFGENKDLLRFHFLLSNLNILDVKNKYEIAKIIKKYNYFEKLSEVFSRNYLKVRKQWFEVANQNTHKYFLIETTKEDIPKIESFFSFQEAENNYFNVYKTRQNANIVLTHLQTPSYNQISIAYSNYVLTFHNFLSDSLEILESLIVESLENKRYYTFFLNFNLYNGLLFSHIKNMMTEIKEINDYSEQRKTKKKLNKKNEREWVRDIEKQVNQSQERGRKLQVAVKKGMPQDFFGKLVIKQIIKRISKNYRKKINKIITNR